MQLWRRQTLAVMVAAILALGLDMAPAAAGGQAKGDGRQAAPPARALPSVRPRQTETVSLKSAEGLDYRIFLSAPEGPPPAGGFPVIYVLDANAWFGLAAEVTRLYELEGGPAIVVGIGYPVNSLYAPQRRGQDFTLGAPVGGETAAYAGTTFGGADAFLKFLRGPLRDTIGNKYPIDRARQSLFGHSLGGYFVLHVLLTQPDSFHAYTAASPAIWWDPARLAAEEKIVAARPAAARPPVLVTVGGAEQKLGPADEKLFRRMHAANPAAFGGKGIEDILAGMRKEMSESGMVDHARSQAERLRAMGFPVDFTLYEEENHRSSVPPALMRSMPLFLP